MSSKKANYVAGLRVDKLRGRGEPDSGATTRRGLRVKAVLDKRRQETWVKISDEQVKDLNIRPCSENPEWNYSILPRGA